MGTSSLGVVPIEDGASAALRVRDYALSDPSLSTSDGTATLARFLRSFISDAVEGR